MDQSKNQMLKAAVIHHLGKGMNLSEAASRTGISYHKARRLLNGEFKTGPRADAGRSRTGLYERVLPEVQRLYLAQNAENNILACINHVWDRYRFVLPGMNFETLKRRTYDTANKQQWRRMFVEIKRKHKAQTFTPKQRYDLWLEVPFMHFWVIDGRKSDALPMNDETGKLVLPKGYYVREVSTGAILNYLIGDSDFDARNVMRLLVHTALQYGPPLVAILCDNGLEQIGGENILAMESFWMDEEIQAYRSRAVPEMRRWWDHAVSPVQTSRPRIPTDFGKASLERFFFHLQRHLDAFVGGNNYMGKGREDQTHTTLMRSPRVDHTTLTISELDRITNWYLFADGNDRTYGIPYRGELHPGSLATFAAVTGQEPTIGNAWDYGWTNYEKKQIPPENLLKLFMHTEEHIHAKVVRDKQIEFQRNLKRYNFSCMELSVMHTGRYVDVILDPMDDARALVMHEGQAIGIATDLDQIRKRGVPRSEISAQIGALSRNAREEIRSMIAPHVKQKKARIPEEYTRPQPVGSPFSLEGRGVEELMLDTLQANNRSDENTGPAKYISEEDIDLVRQLLR